MIFWKFNTFICITDLVLYILCVLRVVHLLKTRYPGVKWVRVTHWSDTVMAVLKMILGSMCPVFNLVMLYILVTKDSEVIEHSIKKTYQAHLEFMQRKENENVRMEH